MALSAEPFHARIELPERLGLISNESSEIRQLSTEHSLAAENLLLCLACDAPDLAQMLPEPSQRRR
jgi:hypothetical protein